MGVTYIGAERANFLRLRYWLMILAGPATTFAIVAAATAVLGAPNLRDLTGPSGAVAGHFALVELVAFCNVWMLVFNLVPVPLFGGGGIFRNDGLQLLTAPFMSASHVESLLAAPTLLEAQERGERGEHEESLRLLEAALARFPGSYIIRNSIAAAQLNTNQLEEARTTFLALLDAEPPSPGMRWAARNNLAWTNFLLRRDDLRAEADEHSDATLERFKQAGWAMGTRGAVLLWLGRHAEAIDMLEGAYLRNSLASHRALNAAALAIAYAATGRAEKAKVWRDRARSNDAACPLLVEAEAAISTAASGDGRAVETHAAERG